MSYSATIINPQGDAAMPMWESTGHPDRDSALRAAQAHIHEVEPTDCIVEYRDGVYAIWDSSAPWPRVGTLLIESTGDDCEAEPDGESVVVSTNEHLATDGPDRPDRFYEDLEYAGQPCWTCRTWSCPAANDSSQTCPELDFGDGEIYWWELCDCHDPDCPVIAGTATPRSDAAERFHHRHYRARAWSENVLPASREAAHFLRHIHRPRQRGTLRGLIADLHVAAHNAVVPEWIYLRHVVARWTSRR